MQFDNCEIARKHHHTFAVVGHGWTVELRPGKISLLPSPFAPPPSEIRGAGADLVAMTTTLIPRYLERYGEFPENISPQSTEAPSVHQSTSPPSPSTTAPEMTFPDGCSGGESNHTIHFAAAKTTVDILMIPTGKYNVKMSLSALVDMDISLLDLGRKNNFSEGQAVIQWCGKKDRADPSKNCGIIGNKATEQTIRYRHMVTHVYISVARFTLHQTMGRSP